MEALSYAVKFMKVTYLMLQFSQHWEMNSHIGLRFSACVVKLRTTNCGHDYTDHWNEETIE